ncbi:hypothetical protein ACVWZA_004275 [Sphingomonas sp. UYAg733]
MSLVALALLALAAPAMAADPVCRSAVVTGMDVDAYARQQALHASAGLRLEREAIADKDGAPSFSALWGSTGDPTRLTHGALGHEAFYFASLEMTGRDYRMTDLTVGVVGGAAWYGVLWDKGRNVQQSISYWISEAELRKIVARSGQRVVAIAPFQLGKIQYFAVLVDVGPALRTTAAVGLTTQKLATETERMRRNGFILRRAPPYGRGKALRYAAVWQRADQLTPCSRQLASVEPR